MVSSKDLIWRGCASTWRGPLLCCCCWSTLICILHKSGIEKGEFAACLVCFSGDENLIIRSASTPVRAWRKPVPCLGWDLVKERSIALQETRMRNGYNLSSFIIFGCINKDNLDIKCRLYRSIHRGIVFSRELPNKVILLLPPLFRPPPSQPWTTNIADLHLFFERRGSPIRMQVWSSHAWESVENLQRFWNLRRGVDHFWA